MLHPGSVKAASAAAPARKLRRLNPLEIIAKSLPVSRASGRFWVVSAGAEVHRSAIGQVLIVMRAPPITDRLASVGCWSMPRPASFAGTLDVQLHTDAQGGTDEFRNNRA